MNIVLIGYRGTGKSAVGRLLAEQLGRTLVSTDGVIIEKAQQSIPEIVEQSGWDYFRDLESTVCKEIGRQDNLVIDTGGGAILRSDNVEHLKTNGVIFWLTADIQTIVNRIGGDTQRPSLTGSKSFVEEIEDVLRERRPKYQAAADHTVSTDDLLPTQVAQAIVAQL